MRHLLTCQNDETEIGLETENREQIKPHLVDVSSQGQQLDRLLCYLRPDIRLLGERKNINDAAAGKKAGAFC